MLVNSAGILRFTALLDLTVQDWNETFSINTRAMLTTMQVCVRSMIEAGTGGKIINLASMAAKTGGAGEGAYPASKAAVVALTRQAALEWGCHGITANALCPGYILTEMGAATRTEEDVDTVVGTAPRSADSANRRMSPPSPSSSQAPTPTTSPARRSTSPVEW